MVVDFLEQWHLCSMDKHQPYKNPAITFEGLAALHQAEIKLCNSPARIRLKKVM